MKSGQVQGFAVSRLSPAAGRDWGVYTKYTHYNSSSFYKLQAIVINSQEKIPKKAASALTKKNFFKMHMLGSRPVMTFSQERPLVKCADLKVKAWEPKPANPSENSLFSTLLVAFVNVTCPGCNT